MARRPASRSDISPFHVMEVMRAAEQREASGAEVLHLEVGQPSTPAPKGVIAAAHRALDEDVLGYTTAGGIQPLRQRISDHYASWYGVDVDPDRVVVTIGASGAFVTAFLAAFEPGDRVVVPSPGYPCYRNALQALGVEVVDLLTTLDTRFQPTPELLETLGRIDGLVLASPSNPAGTMLDSAAMAAIAGWCAEHDVQLISDEIYHGITYGESAATALTTDPDVIVVNSFSKYFSMTGWRLGWMICPPRFLDAVTRISQNVTISAPTLSQVAAVAAFDCHDECRANIERYAANRRVLLDGLPVAGLDRLAPADGAFYIYADVSHLTDDASALCTTWLDELGIAATPGIDFDPTRGHQYVRFSFAGATADMEEAVTRLQAWAAQP
ncbi:MAG: aminotransferase class I/II-fold pyridoxal phosphate-dependent enzyme [Actinomycetia bacterium]|nr:aminotransferase class I/II-fold pyridoxal phosphate-dependent enzyme [Actinomycetes bacterium]